MSATVEITEENGEYTAVDLETGTRGTGKTRAMALAALALRLDAEDGGTGDDDPTELVRTLARRTRARFEEEGATEDDVRDAIAWVRSE